MIRLAFSATPADVARRSALALVDAPQKLPPAERTAIVDELLAGLEWLDLREVAP